MRLPVASSIVHPVSPLPPAKTIDPAPLPVGPIFKVVAAPPTFKVVAVVLIKLKVVREVERVVPLVKSKVPVVPKFKLIWLSTSLSIVSPFWRVISVANVVPDMVKALPVLASSVKEDAVEAALESNPLVIVTTPEIVGVAVQAVPVTVRLPPSEVKLAPDTVKVLSRDVAP